MISFAACKVGELVLWGLGNKLAEVDIFSKLYMEKLLLSIVLVEANQFCSISLER